MVKNLVYASDVADHLNKLSTLKIIKNGYEIKQRAILPGDPTFIFNYEYKYHESLNFSIKLTNTPVFINGECHKHNHITLDDCAQEIRDALELLIFQLDETNMEYYYYLSILRRHLENNIEIRVR